MYLGWDMKEKKGSRYAEAGVDIDKANSFIDRIKPLVSATFQRGVLTDIGGFGGLFALGGSRYKDPVLVASTDGVGTKLKIAELCNKHDTIGIDLVAMCVNDVVVSGARPLFFLDYFAVGELNVDQATDVVRGIAKGCELSKCSLIGGETAEMPGHYTPGSYDLAGFTVGIAERNELIDGSEIKVGDKLIGLASSGIHSNGYSLVRKICFEELGLSVSDQIPELGCTLGEALLEPTRIYTETVLNIIKNYQVRGVVHITGGGFTDNIPRVLPEGSKAVIAGDSWSRQPIFDFLQQRGNLTSEDMYRTFNCGIGMILIVTAKDEEDCLRQLSALGETPYVIGEIAVRLSKEEDQVEIV